MVLTDSIVKKLKLYILPAAIFTIAAQASIITAPSSQTVEETAKEKVAQEDNLMLIADDMEAGNALYNAGRYAEAQARFEKALSGGNADARLWLARIAWLNYDSAKALDIYSAYSKSSAAGKTAALAEKGEKEANSIRRATEMLKRVEDIAIIDSIVVPKSDFFKAYRLDPSCGTISLGKNGVIFANEANDFRMTAMPDTAGIMTLMSAERLTDGSWSAYEPIDTNLNKDSNALYPFMMPDGITLYFASDSDDSIGGLDIFTAQRDPVDGTFLKPSNIGFPYNSPADDYMMAIDEQTGTGWWATDRNLIPGMTTVYVFVPNESRRNCNPDSVDLKNAARIVSIESTQKGEDYSELLTKISNLNRAGNTPKERVFTLRMPKGKVYTDYSDFRNKKASEEMKKYIACSSRLAKAEAELKQERRRYHDRPSKELATKILKHEDEIYDLRATSSRLLSEVYRLELGNN